MGKHKRSRTKTADSSESYSSSRHGEKRRKSDHDDNANTEHFPQNQESKSFHKDGRTANNEKLDQGHTKGKKTISQSRSHHSEKHQQSSNDQDAEDMHMAYGHESRNSRHYENNLRIFPLEDKTQALVILDHPESLTIKGKFTIRCICGSISILGHHIDQHTQTYPVYSPETHSYLSIQTTRGHVGEVLESPHLCSLIDKEQWKSEAHKLSCRRPVIVLLQKLEDSSLDFASSIPPFNFLFNEERKQRNKNISAIAELKSIGVKFYGVENDINSMITSEGGTEVGKWLEDNLKTGGCPVVLVCGGKNVGKSTLTRSLMNAALNIVDEIAYLECDVGQTEFTPPACVAVTTISQPIFGPPFCHQKKPLSCCFTGSVSPGEDPGLYMKCLSFVYDKFKALHRRCPLFVNTMGWTEGIGLALLTDTLRLIQPSLVVQFDTSSSYKNLPDITPEFVATNSGWTTQSTNEETSVSHSLKIIPSVTRKVINDVYSPKELRTLSLLTYMGQIFTETPIHRELISVCPVEIPWHQVAVHVMHMYVPRSQIMYALNASVVALGVMNKEDMLTSEIDGYPKFLKETPVCSCLGLGIIRGIDPVKKVFYLLTPLTLSELSQVNCLLRGILEVPPALLQDERLSMAPYNGYLKEGIGSGCISKRKHILPPNHSRGNT